MRKLKHGCGHMVMVLACLLNLTATAQQPQKLEDLRAEVVRLYGQKHYAQAIEVGKQAIDVAEKTNGPDHLTVAMSLCELAGLYRIQKQCELAEPLFKRALAIREKTLGPDHLDVAWIQTYLGDTYLQQGKYLLAEPCFKRALEIEEKAYGPNHPEVATGRYMLAGLYFSQRQYIQAEPLYRRALEIREKALGPDHLEVAKSLNSLAVLYKAQGQYIQAEPFFKRALEIKEKAYGPNHPEVAASLDIFANLYGHLGQFEQAELLCKRALAIDEKLYGPIHLRVGARLNNLASVYQQQARYAEAALLVKRALTIIEKLRGVDHPHVAVCLSNLAGIYDAQGQYAQAEPFAKRALEINEKAMGPNHPDVAMTLDTVAQIYYNQGQYAQAELLGKRALEIHEKNLGPNHPTVAKALTDIAHVYLSQGQYMQAEPLFKRALEICEKALGPNHPELIRVLNGIGTLYFSQGQYAKAEPLFKHALEINEKTFGVNHPRVATDVNNLAALYQNQGLYAQAEPLLKRALSILEKDLGANHQRLAVGLKNLADIYKDKGEHTQAELLYKRAMAILEEAKEQNHPNMAINLVGLAYLKSAQGQDDAALALRLRANAIREQLMSQVFSFSSENGRFQFLNMLNGERNAFLSLCSERLGTRGTTEGLNFLLRRKGIVLESLMEEAEAARLSGNPALRDQFAQLRGTKTQLASLVLAGPGKLSAKQYQANTAVLQAQAEELEKEIARQSTSFGSLLAARKTGMPEVAAALPVNSALVEFAKYRSFNFENKGYEHRWGTEKYIAYVLRQDMKEPVLVKLGEAQSIDRLINGYQKAIQRFIQKQATVADVNAASEALTTAVWAPVKERLGQAKRVYLSPDGTLNFVSFAGLRDKDGRYVLEDYDLSYISSGRDLARGKIHGDKRQQEAVLFGAPDFGGTAPELDREMITRAGGFRSELASVRAFDGLRFEPLPGTQQEVSVIGKLAAGKEVKAKTYTGLDANEGRVKTIEQPRILHLATHGFFLPESGWANQARDGEMGLGTPTLDLNKWKLKNPMHRSGLALAGANLTLTGKAAAGKEDGILTAEEVAGLNLAGTELVVLSACETGLGEARGGEGVMGLRRAFVQAGAENLVMALWSVSDTATQNLMTAMYGKYLGGQPVWKALLEAQRDALVAERQAGREPNPYLWAAFVVNGVGVQ